MMAWMLVMMTVLLAAAAPGDAPAVPNVSIRSVPMATINIPDEISAAILPYLNCQLASHGVRSGPPGNHQTAPPPAQFGADCSDTRVRAARRAEIMLRDQRRGTPAERRAFVARVLANVDRFAAAGAVPPSSFESKPDAPN